MSMILEEIRFVILSVCDHFPVTSPSLDYSQKNAFFLEAFNVKFHLNKYIKYKYVYRDVNAPEVEKFTKERLTILNVCSPGKHTSEVWMSCHKLERPL